MIRRYQDSDWEEACRVVDLSKPYELQTAAVAASFVPLASDTARIEGFKKSAVYVWEEAGHLRGLVGHQGRFIGWLFVEPAAFRRGIAQALLSHGLGRIAGDPWLWAMKENHPALALYQKNGFTILEERLTENGGLPCTAVRLGKKQP